MFYVTLALIGLVGGISSGLFGVGGGTVFVPAFILLLRYNPHLAIGTSLAVVVPTAIIGILKHNGAHMVQWKIVVIMVIFAMVGAWLGSILSLKLDATLLKRGFAIFLGIVALRLFFVTS